MGSPAISTSSLRSVVSWKLSASIFVVVDQAIDTTTRSGRLLSHVLGATAEFERDLIRERVVSGLKHAETHPDRPVERPRRAVDLDEVLCFGGPPGRPGARSREL